MKVGPQTRLFSESRNFPPLLEKSKLAMDNPVMNTNRIVQCVGRSQLIIHCNGSNLCKPLPVNVFIRRHNLPCVAFHAHHGSMRNVSKQLRSKGTGDTLSQKPPTTVLTSFKRTPVASTDGRSRSRLIFGNYVASANLFERRPMKSTSSSQRTKDRQ